MSSVPPRSDEALYRRLVEGDLAAFDQLFERYAAHLLGFIRHELSDGAEAEDVLQEVFVAVLRQRGRGTAARSVRAWLFEVARHLCLNRARSRRRGARAKAEAPLTAVPAPHLDQALEEHQRFHSLHRALARLPEPLGALYRLRASGLSYQEMAEVLGVPLGTVKSRMHEMLGRLREEMLR